MLHVVVGVVGVTGEGVVALVGVADVLDGHAPLVPFVVLVFRLVAPGSQGETLQIYFDVVNVAYGLVQTVCADIHVVGKSGWSILFPLERDPDTGALWFGLNSQLESSCGQGSHSAKEAGAV